MLLRKNIDMMLISFFNPKHGVIRNDLLATAGNNSGNEERGANM
jgi:hypothetical protein